MHLHIHTFAQKSAACGARTRSLGRCDPGSYATYKMRIAEAGDFEYLPTSPISRTRRSLGISAKSVSSAGTRRSRRRRPFPGDVGEAGANSRRHRSFFSEIGDVGEIGEVPPKNRTVLTFPTDFRWGVGGDSHRSRRKWARPARSRGKIGEIGEIGGNSPRPHRSRRKWARSVRIPTDLAENRRVLEIAEIGEIGKYSKSDA